MSAGHSHEHRHHHPHRLQPAAEAFNRAFAIGIVLNTAFVAVEAFYGWKINSLALLADAGHNLSDVAGLVLAWAATLASKLRADARHTYGWKRASTLAAFVNAVLLLLAMGSLGWEAIGRLRTPEATDGWTLVVVAGIGIVINGATALLFLRGRHDDINIQAAFLHMAADAMVSLGVVVGGALVLWQGWLWIDPLLSLAIALVIVLGTWSLFKQSLHLLFDGVPQTVELAAVRDVLLHLSGVLEVHDLHVWAVGSQEIALTAHVVLREPAVDASTLLQQAGHELHQQFEIRHVTLQLETPAFARLCALRAGVGCS